MSENKEKAIPKWFKGEVYAEGGKVTNPFSNASFELSPNELSMYDFIIGIQFLMENSSFWINTREEKTKQINDFHKAISWFRSANVDAYYVLLD